MKLFLSDASSTGYGGYIVEHRLQIAHGQWSQQEIANSSTWWELCAVQRVLESLAPNLRNESLWWFSNNQNVVQILMVSSRRRDFKLWPWIFLHCVWQTKLRCNLSESLYRKINRLIYWSKPHTGLVVCMFFTSHVRTVRTIKYHVTGKFGELSMIHQPKTIQISTYN